MNRESRKSERTKNQSKATKESTPGDRLAGAKRMQARVSPRGERALRPAARDNVFVSDRFDGAGRKQFDAIETVGDNRL